MAPRVSICLPVRNGARYLREALESVRGQSMADWELVLSDNASDDGTAEAARSTGDARVRVLAQPRDIGMAANFQACFGAARAPWLLFLSHDDRLRSDALDRLLAAAEPDAAFAFGGVRFIDGDGKETGSFLPDLPRRLEPGDLARRSLTAALNFTHWAACLLRREAVDRAGGLRPETGLFFDWNLYLRLSLRGPVSYVREALAEYRIHGRNESKQVRKGSRHAAELMKPLRALETGAGEMADLRDRALRALALRHSERSGRSDEPILSEAAGFLSLPDLGTGTKLASLYSLGVGRLRRLLGR